MPLPISLAVISAGMLCEQKMQSVLAGVLRIADFEICIIAAALASSPDSSRLNTAQCRQNRNLLSRPHDLQVIAGASNFRDFKYCNLFSVVVISSPIAVGQFRGRCRALLRSVECSFPCAASPVPAFWTRSA